MTRWVSATSSAPRAAQAPLRAVAPSRPGSGRRRGRFGGAVMAVEASRRCGAAARLDLACAARTATGSGGSGRDSLVAGASRRQSASAGARLARSAAAAARNSPACGRRCRAAVAAARHRRGRAERRARQFGRQRLNRGERPRAGGGLRLQRPRRRMPASAAAWRAAARRCRPADGRGRAARATARTILGSTTTSVGPPIISRCSTLSRRIMMSRRRPSTLA